MVAAMPPRLAYGWRLGVLAVTLLGSAPAFAQREDRSFNPQLFHPAPGPDEFISVESAVPLRHKQYGIGLFFNYLRKEVSILGYDNSPSKSSDARANIIKKAIALHLWAAIRLLDRFP